MKQLEEGAFYWVKLTTDSVWEIMRWDGVEFTDTVAVHWKEREIATIGERLEPPA